MSNIHFETTRINFRETAQNNWGKVSAEGEAFFPSNIIQAVASIQAIELWKEKSTLTKSIGASVVNVNWEGPKVYFTVTATLTQGLDNTKNFFSNDNSYARIVVMAECE